MSRELVCTRCADLVEVHEHPREWIDPDLYVCGTCLSPVERPQLRLVQGGRSETPAYDPTQMEIPY